MARKVGKYKISERDAKLFDQDASTINTSGTNLTLSGFLKTQGAGTQLGNGTGDTLGFFGATPVDRPSAYTQTYSTADKTVANATAAAVVLSNMTDGSANNTLENVGATNSGDVSSAIEKNFDKIGDEVNALIADVDDLRKTVTAIIDDLQELGLVG